MNKPVPSLKVVRVCSVFPPHGYSKSVSSKKRTSGGVQGSCLARSFGLLPVILEDSDTRLSGQGGVCEHSLTTLRDGTGMFRNPTSRNTENR